MSNNPNNFSQLGLTLLTAPVLVSLIVAKSLHQSLVRFGEDTEEIFRGARLPILHWTNLENKPDDLKK